ncbi:hypothetical protein [Streptomyces sp. NPDC102490]|jgi:hypothetical protein|uniref:hypothetical protein n=1 Tax=Streptomyces sp. NPDC102490 TaxID=3366183 RepID=UPI0038165ABC
MNDTSTTQPIQAAGADVSESRTGHGKHRGPVSSQEGVASPRGRHRKPAEESETAA